jgi:hypothetical protein
MAWIKRGRIFCPDGRVAWMRSHAANPAAEPLGGGRFRVYFSPRDDANRSSIGCFDWEPGAPDRLPRPAEEPVLRPGDPGLFDDSGTSMGCVLEVEGTRYLYYVGWNLGVTVPWRNSIGLAVSEHGGPYRRVSRAPILDRSEVDPFSLSYPWVILDGGVWRMWYGSNLTWGPTPGDMRHVIKYAESADGVSWTRAGHVAIPLGGPEEWAVARPCVLRDGDRYRMWYSRRGERYRLGYAESRDGVRWERKDAEAGLDVSATGWDAEMIAYACVCTWNGRGYMLYNGNGYGKTGIGFAETDLCPPRERPAPAATPARDAGS